MEPTGHLEEVHIDTGEVKLHCVVEGEGELVILLHGFPEFWYSWRHQIPFLARGFKVVAPDMRGYNLSEKPTGIEAYDVSHLTSDVLGIMDNLGYDSASVVGHDWGGAVSWMTAANHPDRVHKLAVLNCPHPAVFAQNLLKNPMQILRSYYMLLFQLPRLPEALLSILDFMPLKRVFTDWALREDTFGEQDLERLASAAAQPGALTSSINYYRALFRNRQLLKTREEFPTIRCPTLLVWAEDDRALGKELTFGMDRYFEGPLQVKYIPNCSHWVQQEQPLLVNQFLWDFLREGKT